MISAGIRIAYGLQLSRVPFLPVSLDIEPNNTCNFRCGHCQRTHWDKPQRYLSIEEFEGIIRQFPNLASVKIQGMGEPLMNESLMKMLESGEMAGLAMTFFTNGMLCSDKTARKLVRRNDLLISFSVDAATPELFQKIRIGGDIQKIRTNIKNIVKLRGQCKQPEIRIWTVIMRENLRELSQIVLLAKEAGVDSIAMQPFVTGWGKASMEAVVAPMRVQVSEEDVGRAIDAARRTATGCGIKLEIMDCVLRSSKNPCDWPWRSAFIAVNGDVLPCCQIADAAVVKMGNIFEQSFKEIWNNKAYRALRRQIRNHDLPEFCKPCYGDKDLLIPTRDKLKQKTGNS